MEVSISVRSQDRISGDRNTFVVALPETLQFKRVTLVDAELPLTMYTIGDNNSSFSLVEYPGGGPPAIATVTIQQGMIQTPQALATALAAALNAVTQVPQVYAATYDIYTDLISISAAAAFQLQFAETDYVADVLGFEKGQSYASVGGLVRTVKSCMLAPQDLYLTIPELPTKGLTAKRPSLAYTFKLALNGQRYNITDYLGYQHDQSVGNGQPLTANKLSVSLRDGNGLSPGIRSDWSFTLKLCN